MTENTKFNAAILIIGNEILSGRTQDTNTGTIAKWLNSIGVTVNEVRVIPDIESTIVETVNHLRKVNNYVFTTGGIGPTHDDITAQSISKAFNLEYEIHQEAFKILEAYYKVGEFNEGRQKMVWMPKNANLILNPTSGAPGFYVENVFCLPGVPSILKSMLGGLKDKIVGGNPIISHTISLKTLIEAVKKGYKSYLLFLVQIQGVNNFKIAKDIDKEYYENYLLAKKAGVIFLAYQCKISKKEIKIDKKIKIIDV
jgi:molybdenum cofactor synthesis domain-containing protein